MLELKHLPLAREALVRDRTAAKNRGKVLILALLKRQIAQRLDQIAAVETAMRDIVYADHDLRARFDIRNSIPGVSAITAFALLVEMPELGTL